MFFDSMPKALIEHDEFIWRRKVIDKASLLKEEKMLGCKLENDMLTVERIDKIHIYSNIGHIVG